MIKVGLTGGIGSGKSYVSLIFKEFNIPIYNSDIEAKKLYYRDDVKSEMLKYFGNEVYVSSGEIDKKYLSKLIFSDKKALYKVNEIIHPLVKEHFSAWSKIHYDSAYIIKEAAILFESGAYKQLDKVVVVIAPEELRMRRVLARDNIDKKQIKEKMLSQMAESEMIKRSDFVIINDEKNALLPQINKLHQLFSKQNI